MRSHTLGCSLVVASALIGTSRAEPSGVVPPWTALAESWPIRIPDNVEYLDLGTIPLRSLRVPSVINVEVDIMSAATHTHHLYSDELSMISKLFLCEGIILNIEISDTIPEIPVIDLSMEFETLGPTGFKTIKNAWADHAEGTGWHYCIMAHQFDFGAGPGTSSGYAELLGDDFVVTLGTWSGQVGEPFQRAGTFLHELGHNLGLLHAGGQSEADFTQYKPNYASVMTYRCQVTGVRNMNLCSGLVDSCHAAPFRDLDFSHGLLPPLDENALVEGAGIGLGPVDWDCDFEFDSSPVVQDLAAFTWCPPPSGHRGVSLDYDDWSNLVDVTYLAPVHALANRPGTSCLDLDQLASLVDASRAGGQAMYCSMEPPPVTHEPCVYLDADPDLDTWRAACDNCPVTPNGSQADADGDTWGDMCDNCPAVGTPGNVPLLTGDANNNGTHAADDIILLVNCIFKNGVAPIPAPLVGDVNCSGDLTSADIIVLVNYVFKSGPPPCDVCAL